MTAFPYSNSVTELSKYIRLPFPPNKACWQVYKKGSRQTEIGPIDWELIAILDYDSATTLSLRTQMSEQADHTELYVTHEFVKDWFPELVKQRFIQDDIYTEYFQFKGSRYNPGLFIQSPLSGGFVTIIDNLIFLFAHTM